MKALTAAATRMTRIRALLAGGLVLGLGATATLASWNSSEDATGTFTAGTFDLQGSTDGSNYTNSESGPSTLGFTVAAQNLAPTQTVFAPFAVRLTKETTTGAVVAIRAASSTGTVTGLTYELLRTTELSCDENTTGTVMVQSGAAMTQPSSGGPTFNLAKGSAAGVDGAPAYFCFRVTAGADLKQGQTGTATWQFAATSGS